MRSLQWVISVLVVVFGGASLLRAGDAAPDESAVAEGGMTWLGLGEALATAAEANRAAPNQSAPASQPASRPATQPAGSFVPLDQRRGPAYPGDVVHSLGRFSKELPGMVLDDAKSVVTNPVSLVALGAAAATGISLSASRADANVGHYEIKHGNTLNSFWDTVGDAGGNPGTHFAVAGAMWFGSQFTGDTKMYETSNTLLSGLAINGLVTLVVKGATDTGAPNRDRYSFLSGHTSSSFCFAEIMNEAYGPAVGVPLYVFAGFVGWERIDARNHNFSDVISGALLGFAVGYAVSKNHQWKMLGMNIVPMLDPENGSMGLALAKEW